jgi:hypothetical protein
MRFFSPESVKPREKKNGRLDFFRGRKIFRRWAKFLFYLKNHPPETAADLYCLEE